MEVGNSTAKTYIVSRRNAISFAAEQREIEAQLFINYRSLVVKIGENEYRPQSRGKGINLRLSEEIKGFLRDRENLAHLNLISQTLNKWDFFEIWNNSDVGGTAHVKSGLIGTHNMFLPEAVLKVVHEGVEIERKFADKIEYFPVWQWEGNRNSSRSKHWIHFDLLVYILSKVFVEFRREFMALLTVELRIGNMKNETLEEIRSRREIELEVANQCLQLKNDGLMKEIRSLHAKLDKALNKIDNLNTKIDTLNHKLGSFAPTNASTHSVNFSLRLYLSDRHPTKAATRAKARNGKIWVGVYCGEISNFTKTVRDPRARVLVTFPVNSRDSLVFINTVLGDEMIEEMKSKHWLIEAKNLPEIIDIIAQTLINNDAIVDQVDLNHDLLNEIANVEPEEVVEEVVPDPIEPPRPEYNFAELALFEYYYKNRYRELREDAGEHRLYFHVGNAGARVREYVNPEAVLRLRRRRV